MSKAATPVGAKAITIDGRNVRTDVIYYMQLMEQQKERVGALLLAIKEQLDPDTHCLILASLAEDLQEDHGYWYRLQDLLGIQADVRTEGDHE